MSALTFDTHRFVKKLEEKGFSVTQAEGINDALQDALQVAEVATKQDLSNTEMRLEVKIAETKAELIRWVVGAGFLQTALIAALMLKLMH